MIGVDTSLEEYIDWIHKHFSDIKISERVNIICETLAIKDKSQIEVVKKANLLAYAKQHGLVTNYAEACDKLGIDTFNFDGLSSILVAFQKLGTIIKALNNGWCPDWNNNDEYKYFPYFRMNGGFSYSDTRYFYYFYTDVCSALCLKNKDLSFYCGHMFLDLYEKYYSESIT